jgi:serpin B
MSMKYLSSIPVLLLNGLLMTACVSNADVAQKNAANAELTRSSVPAVTNPDITDEEYATFIADANDFGLALYQQMNGDLGLAAQNDVFSPASAQLALAMTYGAAAGETAAAMKTTLRDTVGSNKYHAACNRLQRDLASRNASGTNSRGFSWRIELSPANSLWTDRTVAVKTPYLDLLSQQYDTGLWRTDFMNQPEPSRLAINAWVMDHTHDRIENLLQQGDVDNTTRFVLVNALYFYGSWLAPFDSSGTQPAVFHTLAGTDVNTSTMHSGMKPANYKSTDNFEVLQLAYGNGDLWMTLVLPASGQFEATRSQVSGQWLADATAGLTSVDVQLSIPKFKITTPQRKLNESLTAMGMGIALSQDTADFTGMTDEKPLYIYDVVQKAFISIDEHGTEASAATFVMGGAGSEPPTPIPVTLDRPFLFFVQDKTGPVLFAGQVVDPTQ